jgi:hypothetical protein
MKRSKNNNFMAFVIILIVVVALGVYVYESDQTYKVKRNSDLLSYKKSLYETVFCQYNCPLKFQLYQNKTQLLPDLECVKNCTIDFKKKYSPTNLNKLNFTKQELGNDNFFNDIELLVENCKKQSTNPSSIINNSEFFSCSIKGLELVKERYNYLKI